MEQKFFLPSFLGFTPWEVVKSHLSEQDEMKNNINQESWRPVDWMLLFEIKEGLDQENVDDEDQGKDDLNKGLNLKGVTEVKLSEKKNFK